MIDGDDEQETSSQVIQVTTDRLCKDYSGNNEAKADIVYKDKKLLVTGIIGEISEMWGSYSLELLTSDGSDNASANFNKKYINVLAELKKGQKYTVYCTCTGKSLGTPILKDCQPKS